MRAAIQQVRPLTWGSFPTRTNRRHTSRFFRGRKYRTKYTYDAEGNRILRTEIATGHVTEYEWDHRNRLIRVTERASAAGPATQVVEHSYDYLNRWIARAVDTDGAGPLGFDDTYFVYDGPPEDVSLTDRAAVTEDNIGQIVLQFDDDAQGDPQLSHRYLWGDAVDQVLADEQVDDVSVEGDALWPLTDHLGTVRDLVEYDDVTGVTSVTNHRTYDAFGRLVSETNAAVDHLFAFTGRATDEFTGLQNNLNRWYDSVAGRWVSVDPIGFDAGDANLFCYVYNASMDYSDPSGLFVSWTQLGGGLKAMAGACEAFVGVSFAVATSWSGVGIVLGGAVTAHGVDVFWSGVRQAWNNEETDTFRL